MSLLRGTTKTIQIEAFHVFKIFVANPRKSDPIKSILYRNRPKLIEFLNGFQKDRNDEQFHEEKSILLATLVNLEPPPGVEP
jgi:calcium binding protein 39